MVLDGFRRIDYQRLKMGTVLNDAIKVHPYRIEKIPGSEFISREIQEMFAPIELMLQKMRVGVQKRSCVLQNWQYLLVCVSRVIWVSGKNGPHILVKRT